MRSLYLATLLAAITQAQTVEESGAPDLLEIFDGDDSYYQVDEVDTSVTEIDYTVTEATNIKGNKDEKIDYVEFDWENFQLSEWDMNDLLALVGSDEAVNTLRAALREDVMARYSREVENLPEVCEPGKECRREIRTLLQQTVKQRWQDMLEAIRYMIQDVASETREHLKTAYTEAFYCDHGCECQFVENTYSYLLTQIENYEEEIEGWRNEITVLQGRIDGVPYECEQEFSGFREQYNAVWAEMQAANDAQIAALDDWTADGWDMDSAVDQEQFEAKFGFRYDAQRFDSFYENEEYAAAVANLE